MRFTVKKVSDFLQLKINLYELPFDFIIAFMTPIIAGLMLRNDGQDGYYAAIAYPKIFFFILYLFVPFYISQLLQAYDKYAGSSGKKKGLFISIGIFAVFSLNYSLFMDTVPEVDRLGIVQGSHLWWYLAGLFCILTGVLAGSYNFTEDEPEPSPLHMGVIVGMIFIIVIGSLYTVMTQSNDPHSDWVTGVFSFLGGLVLVIGLLSGYYYLCLNFADSISEIRTWRIFFKLIRDLAFPLTGSSLLVVWGAATLAPYVSADDTAGIGRIILQLTLGGIIPLRVLIAAYPPVRPLNIAIAVISIGAYVYYWT